MQDRLAQMCVALMRDKVNSVRLAAAEALCLTSLIRHEPGPSDDAPAVAVWAEAIVIPQLYNLMQRSSARERQIALYMIQILVSVGAVTPDVTIGVLVPLLINASQDVVSNVRLSVAKSLNFFMRSDSEGPSSLVAVLAGHVELGRCLKRLSDDEDFDVNLHANQANATFSRLSGNEAAEAAKAAKADGEGAVQSAEEGGAESTGDSESDGSA